MAEKPYWTADFSNGWTGEELGMLGGDAQKEVLKAWFHQNFEDPAESTPYDSSEGGYQFIWGGPYQADEVLWDEFATYGIPEDVINEVVQEITRDGMFDWAPVHRSIPDRLDDRLDDLWYPLPLRQPGVTHPRQEADARTAVLARIEALERAVEALNENPPVLGNNREPWTNEPPPFSLGEYRDIDRIMARIREQANASSADPAGPSEEVSKLRELAITLGQWLKDRLTSGADALAKTLGVALAAKVIGLYEAMVELWQAVANWVGQL